MTHVLVLNSGSSSLKYQLIDLAGPSRLARGSVDRIGQREASITHGQRSDGAWDERRVDATITDHRDALGAVVEKIRDAGLDRDLAGIGHRVVHGGDRFVAPTVVTDDVVAGIRDQIPLAPLHNPANLTGIEVARDLWPDIAQVAVFDTAFHADLPPRAYRYAVPEGWYRDLRVRRYGFHGTSHAFVARAAADVLERPLAEVRLITAHLGNGASMTAVAGGRSVDTSMGLSPLEGLVMGTRSGDIDPAVVFHVVRTAGTDVAAVEHQLNSASGMLALAGASDLRVIEQRAAGGDAAAELALDVFSHRIRKYVGAYVAVLGGLDALVFTAGIGEHSPIVRERVCAGLEALGIQLDAAANAASAPVISTRDSPAAVLVIPTDEELEIARQTMTAISGRAVR